MSRYVIDASVLIKLFVEEEGSHAAAALIKPTDELLAPDLLWAEVGNVLWKYARCGAISAGDAQAMLDDMLQMPIETEACRDLVEPALAIASTTGRTVYDALYLAMAVDRNAPLLTADEKFANALARTALAGNIRYIGQQR